MTQDVIDQQDAEPTAEQLQQDEQAAFEAGYSQASGEEQPPVIETPVESKPVEKAADVVEEAVEETTDEDEIAGLPVSKVREYLADVAEMKRQLAESEQHRDRLYGSLGSLKQQLQELASKPQQASAGGVKLTAATFKRLSGEYPELANLLAEDLSETVFDNGGAQPAPAFDAAQLEPMLTQRDAALAERLSRQYEAKLLSLAHPDWKATASSTEFKLWKDMQEPEVRQTLENSWDAQVLGEGLQAFKDWRAQQQAKTVSKKQRLERAIQPSGVPATSDTATEYDAFIQGFKQARGTS